MSTHKYLDTTGLGQVWEKVKDYADPFIVTITKSGSGDNVTYSSDKTFAEITAAYNNEKNIIGVYSAYPFTLTLINNNICRFISTSLASTNNLGTATSSIGFSISN